MVTVRSNPTVDELAATIGLTLMLNKFGKHTTAVFSGKVPSTLEFLKPEDTLEATTDSLRDFIVSLDKSKADKLRYKVEENVVKIFITPYRTSISEKDLEFSQGDFNVDIVMALGVTQREELDQAITAHGRILHDATVATIIAGQRESGIGNINWQEPAASSLSEMLVSISEALQGGLIDEQIATAFLTGIVAETERFSNPKTTPKVMTMAAQLMAAGANQQLIANELQKVEGFQAAPGANPDQKPVAGDDGSLSIPHSQQSKPEEKPASQDEKPVNAEAKPEAKAPGDSFEPLLPPPPQNDAKGDEPEPRKDEIHIDDDGNLLRNQMHLDGHKVIEPLGDPNKPVLPPLDGAPAAAPAPPPPADLPPLPGATQAPQPSAPESHFQPDASDTLQEIEESVHSPHLNQPAAPPAEDQARNAVQSALGQAQFDPAGQVRADLNAMPMGPPAPAVPAVPPAPSFPPVPPAPAAPSFPPPPEPAAPAGASFQPPPQVTAPSSPAPAGPNNDNLPPPPPVPPPLLP